MRKLWTLLCLTALIGTSACETIEGAGRDLTMAGQTVTTEAQQAAP